MSAVAVVVTGALAGASVVVAKTGTESSSDGVIRRTTWYPFTIQERSEVVSFLEDASDAYGVAPGTTLVAEWYPNGQLSSTGQRRNDIKEGIWTEYWPNGEMRFQGRYKNDRLDGVETWFYDNGQEEWSGSNVDGRRDGVETWWWPNGAIRRTGQYMNGEKNGIFKSFSESGELLFITTYQGGVITEQVSATSQVASVSGLDR